jgi:hypothetical protein
VIEPGLIVGGHVVPGTDWVRRDSRAWFEAGQRGTRDRGGVETDILAGHWTGGPCRTGEGTARLVVAAMRARKRDDGSPLDVGIHGVIGWDGLVWQTADLATATVHVSDRRVIRRSIGFETCWPGTASQARKLGIDGPYAAAWIVGHKTVVLPPSEALLASWVRLAETLASLPPETGISIPRHVPVFGASRRFSLREQRAWSGGQEHCHIPSTRKLDGGGYLVGALSAAGWASAQP